MTPDQEGQPSPPWLDVAIGELGTREFRGSETNPEILKYWKATSLGGHPSDEVPWCAAFAGWCLQQAGYRGTRRANARSYLSWGEELLEPRVGAITVLWRGDKLGPNGHVGFLTAVLPYRVVLLGGNENNGVSFKEYGSGRVLQYRWPRELDRIHPT